MNCPECCTDMEIVSTDDRQEWCRTIYYCQECNKDYSRLITRKQQSSMIESDEWEDYENEKNHLSPVFECVFYDGEEGVYRLLDFDPNQLDKGALRASIEISLAHECFIDPDDIKQAMENVYLLDTNALVKVE